MLTGLLLATLAGGAIPIGAWIASTSASPGDGRSDALHHAVIAFGAGALISAVALVLVPEGAERVPAFATPLLFVAGGVVFAAVDRALARRGGHAAQFLAMMLDYVPEALALGALLGGDPATALLLAGLIGLQNLPEGYNAFGEMRRNSPWSARRLLLLFAAMVPIGPLMAWLGMAVFEADSAFIGGVMLFSAGGILYLLIEDVVPQVPVERTWAPPLGAVAGFALGLAGHVALP